MSQGFFITGTDTDVGKTFIASQLIQSYRQLGKQVLGFKPVASGAQLLEGELKNQDALLLSEYASYQLAYKSINPYCFEPAIAPHIAAEQVSIEIALPIIRSSYNKLAEQAELVIVEGAGGWRVPLGDSLGFDDVAKELDLDVILVIGMKLGCISHALLTEQAIIQKGCRLVGWVANCLEPEFTQINETIETLEKTLTVPCLGIFEYQKNRLKKNRFDATQLASLLNE